MSARAPHTEYYNQVNTKEAVYNSNGQFTCKHTKDGLETCYVN